jgi:hypothetical protein
MLLLSGLGLFGTVLMAGSKKGTARGKSLMLVAVLALLATGTMFTVACGNYSNHQPRGNQATLTITGTSGGVNHSVPVSVTVQ